MPPGWVARIAPAFQADGALQPFRLLRQDWRNIPKRYLSDWKVFNQLIVASAVYVFFTNLLPGITFASDLYVLTGKNWGTIEVVFSTGLCGIIFSLYVFFLTLYFLYVMSLSLLNQMGFQAHLSPIFSHFRIFGRYLC